MILTLSKNFDSTQVCCSSCDKQLNHISKQNHSTGTVHINDNEWHPLIVTNDSLIMTR